MSGFIASSRPACEKNALRRNARLRGSKGKVSLVSSASVVEMLHRTFAASDGGVGFGTRRLFERDGEPWARAQAQAQARAQAGTGPLAVG